MSKLIEAATTFRILRNGADVSEGNAAWFAIQIHKEVCSNRMTVLHSEYVGNGIMLITLASFE